MEDTWLYPKLFSLKNKCDFKRDETFFSSDSFRSFSKIGSVDQIGLCVNYLGMLVEILISCQGPITS